MSKFADHLILSTHQITDIAGKEVALALSHLHNAVAQLSGPNASGHSVRTSPTVGGRC